ncbi:UNVERIFIED_CONTAM: hypothetical protein Sangu_2423000 [Sesamum angustifolium]|uniref:Hydrophobic seed protein domain-containing protein n=1 Tax=Sesamum angustifolium TaxID=2727405 RepID=A0AAW2KXE9_9LAMI
MDEACCPVLKGLPVMEAAVCLCTSMNARLLNTAIIIPKAFQLLIHCGQTPPSGFRCS